MKNIFEFIKSLFIPKSNYQFLGVIPQQNEANVYDFKEVVAQAANPVWIEKTANDTRKFFYQFQFSSSSCVAFTVAKIAQVLFFLDTQNKVKFSPGWIYKQRSPKIAGMSIDNAVAIAGGGLPTEELYPSEGLTEYQINNLPDLPYTGAIAKEFAISTNWVEMPLDFDTVASTIQATKKGIMLWFDFGPGEWFGLTTPIKKLIKLPYTHSVCATDFILFQGVPYIVIEDSADRLIGEFGHRKLISREFFNRCWLARYPINFKFDSVSKKPSYNGSIYSLQDCLRFDGDLATNVPSTGFLGNLTIEATKKFQTKYGIQQTGAVGPITRQKLVELFP